METIQNASETVVINGNIHAAVSMGFFQQNRAFRLGDGFFDTVRIIHGKPHLWPAHYKRIAATARALKMEIPSIFSEDFMAQSIRKLMEKREIFGGGKLRFTFFREGEGTYKPTTNRMGYLLEAQSLNHREFSLNDKGLNIEIYPEGRKQVNALSRFKIMGNYLSISAAGWAQDKNLDDALLMNESERIIEATSSNIFIVRNGELHTPAISDGCVGGIMRMAVINAALNLKIPVYESELAVNDITFADEVFLTNAIRGVSWVGGFRNKRYFHKLSDLLLSELNKSQSIS